jgi:hypothetical protein
VKNYNSPRYIFIYYTHIIDPQIPTRHIPSFVSGGSDPDAIQVLGEFPNGAVMASIHLGFP